MTRPTYERECHCCGAAFTAKHPGAKWCHLNCRVQAHYCRKRGEPIRPAHSSRHDVGRALTAQSHQQSVGVEARVWQHTAIQRKQDDGYANATAMCHANAKHLPHYLANARTADYIAALATSLSLPSDRLVVSTTTGPNALRGTWIHPRLAIDLARWISPQFAVWMDGWFLESLSRPQQPQQALPLTPGVYVVAHSPRQARWLWALAVEAHVSTSLMAAITTDRERDPSFQTHLIPAPSPD